MTLPTDLSTEQYASVVQSIYLVLAVHQLAGTSSVLVDGQAKDADMNAAFDQACVRVVIDRIGYFSVVA